MGLGLWLLIYKLSRLKYFFISDNVHDNPLFNITSKGFSVSHIYAYFVFYFIFVDLEPKILKFNFFLKYNNFLFVLQNVNNLRNLPGFLNFL